MGGYYIYTGVMLIFANLDILADRRKKLLVVSACLFIALFIGFRYELGVDWLFYRDFYNGGKITLTIEPGYQLISLIFYQANINFWFFSFFVTIFMLFSLIRIVNKYSPYPAFVLSLYFIVSFGFNVEALRQIIAVSLFYIALNYYLSSKKKNYYIFCLLGMLFHVSSIVLLLFPFIVKRKAIKLGRLSLGIGLGLAVIGLYPVIQIFKIMSLVYSSPYIDKLVWYSSGDLASSVITFNLIFKLIIYCLFLKRKKAIFETFSRFNINHSALLVFEVCFLLMLNVDVFLGQVGTISSRFDEYFIPSMLIIISYVIFSYNKRVNRVLLACGISLCVFISFQRFTSNDYFMAQYAPYSNSIIEVLKGHSDDAQRENEVKLHWQSR